MKAVKQYAWKLNKLLDGTGTRAVEVLCAVYVFIETLLQILDSVGILRMNEYGMKPTFLGASLLIVFLWQLFLTQSTDEDTFFVKLRPFLMGIAAANILATGNLRIILLFLLELGYYVTHCYAIWYYRMKPVKSFLLCSVVLEIYSIAYMITGTAPQGSLTGFLKSAGADILLVLAVILYCTLEGREREHIWGKQAADWCHMLGMVFTVFLVGILLFYTIATSIGNRKLYYATEEVFSMINNEDPTQALTATWDKKEQIHKVSFKKYTGSDSQKIRLETTVTDAVRLIFQDTGYALTVKQSDLPEAKKSDVVLTAEPVNDNLRQMWIWTAHKANEGEYRLDDRLGRSLYYLTDTDAFKLGKDGMGFRYMTAKRTVEEEYYSQTVALHGAEFTTTTFMETAFHVFGKWMIVAFMALGTVFFAITFSGSLIGRPLSFLYLILLVENVMYDAFLAMCLLVLSWILQCYFVKRGLVQPMYAWETEWGVHDVWNESGEEQDAEAHDSVEQNLKAEGMQ